MHACGRRGGLILYRTVIKGAALQGTAVLDISEPVRDYARVSLATCFAKLAQGADLAWRIPYWGGTTGAGWM